MYLNIKYKDWAGSLVLLIAAITYIITLEPTNSFWDCGEFIASAFKLEVGHPPGAPLYIMIGRIFSLFAFGNLEAVAYMVNLVSAISSAFTIWFLFHTIYMLSKKLFIANELSPKLHNLLLISASAVGALVYTFSDTFWFSAVEGEVYATSSLFTAVVFWAILKWEKQADQANSNRWLVLIAYLMGLSIGVHLLNLLVIPAIVMVYWFKKHTFSMRGLVLTLLFSAVLLGVFVYGIIPWLPQMASYFELFAVNSLGLPFNSGLLLYGILLVGLVTWGIYYSIKQGKEWLNLALTFFAVVVIGYSSYAVIVVRSAANPPMDENNPEQIFSLVSYLNREQYGNRPLVYGQYYSAPVDAETHVYTRYPENGKYIKVKQTNPEVEHNSNFTTLFPRMYSASPSHIQEYENWAHIKGTQISFVNRYGDPDVRTKPSFMENVRFFVSYQVGHMYLRYFMWNFVGRQNDRQGHGSITRGNWISGIDFIDSIFLGNQSELPDFIKYEPSRNAYYFLPFLLGLFGLVFHYTRSKRGFFVVFLLFILTGLAIVIYLNQTPLQPRERDYAYAGSFYAFSIWVGMGVLGLGSWLFRKVKPSQVVVLPVVLLTLVVPAQMATENYHDHNRAGRYTARDLAINYLESCEQNAILFTFGDNDTFPLWYAQEVEGVRTDVRVVNTSLLGTDWYINQMKRQAYRAAPVPISLSYEKYIQGKRDLVPLIDKTKQPTDLRQIIEFVASENPATKLRPGEVEEYNFIPSKQFLLPVDSVKVLKNGTITANEANKMLSELAWSVGSNFFTKSDLIILDILATNNWERPVYFTLGSGSQSYLGLHRYFRLEGFAYRLVPIKTEPVGGEYGYINPLALYKTVMDTFVWGNMYSDRVHTDQQNIRVTGIIGIRMLFVRLANSLTEIGETEKAIEVLAKIEFLMPGHKYPYDTDATEIVKAYYLAGSPENAQRLGKIIAEYTMEYTRYYTVLGVTHEASVRYSRNTMLLLFGNVLDAAKAAKDNKFANELRSMLGE